MLQTAKIKVTREAINLARMDKEFRENPYVQEKQDFQAFQVIQEDQECQVFREFP